jgi:hypothetical protein
VTVTVDPGLVAALAASSGNAQVELRDSSDPDVARRAMQAARAAVYTVPHPEEPDDPLPSYVSEVEDGPRGPRFSIDMADAEGYEGLIERVVATMSAAIDSAGGDGTLTSPEAISDVSSTPTTVGIARTPTEEPELGPLRELTLSCTSSDLTFVAVLDDAAAGGTQFRLVGTGGSMRCELERRAAAWQGLATWYYPGDGVKDEVAAGVSAIDDSLTGTLGVSVSQLGDQVRVSAPGLTTRMWGAPEAEGATIRLTADDVVPPVPIALPDGTEVIETILRDDGVSMACRSRVDLAGATSFFDESLPAGGWRQHHREPYHWGRGYLTGEGFESDFTRGAGEALALRVLSTLNGYDQSTETVVSFTWRRSSTQSPPAE